MHPGRTDRHPATRIPDRNVGIGAGDLNRLGVESLLQLGWQGAAATSYHQLQDKWNQDAAKLNRVLGEIKDAIDNTSSQYTATEQEQHAGLSRITSALG